MGAVLHAELSRQLEDRLGIGWSTPPVQLAAAPLALRIGRALSPGQLGRWLDQLGYIQRDEARGLGEFSIRPDEVTLVELDGETRGRRLRIGFSSEDPDARILRITAPPARQLHEVRLGAPLLSTLDPTARRKRRVVPLEAIPTRVVQAVLAAEDHRFFNHAGIDPIRIAGAAVTNVVGRRPYLVGGSTLTQQLVKNALLSPAQTISRKLHEQALALLLERRLSKTEILELYLNDVYLGQRDTFAVHGVSQGARALFGKDLRNLTLGEAAMLAGIIQAPQAHAPHRHPDQAARRRNGVLHAMVERGYIGPDAALEATREPVGVGRPDGAGDVEAPYFVDTVARELAQDPEQARLATGRVDTTLDLRLQTLAEQAVEGGLRSIADRRAETEGNGPQAALIAVDPRTGAVRALVGGSSYLRSQFDRATRARRQPGSIVKPFVYLAALERSRRDPSFNFGPDTLVDDSPTTFSFGNQQWRPENYGAVYDGPVPARLALARSRNVAAVKVGEAAGFETIATLWAAASGSPVPPAYPALALGVFEATPWQVATAYATLANGGRQVTLHTVARDAGDAPAPALVAAESARSVGRMLEDTLDLGTAVSARRAGFQHRAAGKTGSTDDLRDAWFAGFTEELLTVVWVGLDDGSPLGLTGADAALPIWTTFMQGALDDEPPPSVETVSTGTQGGTGILD